MQELEKFKKQKIEETAKFFGGQGDNDGTQSVDTVSHFCFGDYLGSVSSGDWDDEGCC